MSIIDTFVDDLELEEVAIIKGEDVLPELSFVPA
jgi:hypothetical protein